MQPTEPVADAVRPAISYMLSAFEPVSVTTR